MRDSRACVSRRAERRARYSSAGACIGDLESGDEGTEGVEALQRPCVPRFGSALREDCRIEKANERRDAAEHGQQLRVEARACRELRRMLAPADELLAPQVIGGRMILQVAARHACQPLATELADRRPKPGGRDHAMEPPI